MGVATLLEVAWVLKDRPLKRPLILLFNEGEELGLVGARAFLADPLSRNVDSLINLEARGVRGPANMFETSRPNAAPVALFARAAAHPVANSFSTDVYRLMPNYTDVNSFDERGWLTLNIAPIGNETRYHSPGDELAALDHRTLQHMGDQTLALAEGLTAGPAPRGDGDQIFMDVSGWMLIALPLRRGGAARGLLIAFGWLAWRRGGVVRSAVVVFVGTALLSAAMVWAAVDPDRLCSSGHVLAGLPDLDPSRDLCLGHLRRGLLIARAGQLTRLLSSGPATGLCSFCSGRPSGCSLRAGSSFSLSAADRPHRHRREPVLAQSRAVAAIWRFFLT